MKKDFHAKMAHKEELMKSKDESIKWISDEAEAKALKTVSTLQYQLDNVSSKCKELKKE